MFSIGKTSVSDSSPEFFHLPNVPVSKSIERSSHKYLKPILKLGSSIENPLSMKYSSTINALLLKPQYPNQEFSYKSAHSLSQRTPETKFDLKHSLLSQSKGDTLLLSTKLLKNSGKSINSPRTFKTRSEKIEILKNKLDKIKKNQKIQDELSARLKVAFYIEGDEKIQIKHKGSKLQILNKEIEEFETRLEKIKLSPKTITTQKEMYKINQNKFNPTRFFQGTSLESKEF